MRVLVVQAHPCADSFNAAVRDKAVAALEAAGHEVRVADLYAEGFDPVMGAEERRRYHDRGENEKPVAGEIERLLWAEGLVFVYPTWWFGLPAILKGWLDRVFVPHVTFTMPPGPDGLKGRLQSIRAISVVTTCGATWFVSKLMGEPGRRTILRGIRALCHRRCRTRYHALYQMDTVSLDARTRFLAEVDTAMRRFGR
ncbi:NAD(P)H-dependent oxidoreductase [Amorphus orientalis]|uniref:NADPH-quinone reductase n=1 Tax=Amorphus orientalis TaxID=649198 RepID=A0AAE4ARD9_9HYPH|nr:NAD(P)H-dependent oxidoreductase [Amorphus orientalis]MDQ0313903.1 putative NADPH-quinone reductase [Amorphus orientalis]